MITAKKAKEKIIKSISKRKYIQKIKQHIENAIKYRFFECNVTITKDDVIDWDMNKTLFHIFRYFEYYGYSITVVNREQDKAILNVSWHRA